MSQAEWLKVLIPVILVQIALMVTALVYLFRAKAVRGNKWIWVPVIVLVNIVGPVLFFAFGRKEE
ncbi:PLDc N-terminal domain-containing protein [Cohnella boryungensis]|jgi:hypothetical protein|uniref:PLD nuclease N-terminal domain-containing protein n=1 Tax=Cohnella boryungensis TaxID=768479 RepID=A0ABV8SAL4_9BACL